MILGATVFQQGSRHREREDMRHKCGRVRWGGCNHHRPSHHCIALHSHPNPHESPQKQEQVKTLTRMMKSRRAGDGGRSGLTGTCSTCQGTLHQAQGTGHTAPDTRYKGPGALHWHIAQGTLHTTPSPRYWAHYTRHKGPGTRHTTLTPAQGTKAHCALGRLGRHTALQLEDIKATCSNVKTNTHTHTFSGS